jgi:hypothetical protein
MMRTQETDMDVLCLIVKDGGEIMINSDQRTAIDRLGELARSGDSRAFESLLDIQTWPWLHPHLREMVVAELRLLAKERNSG